MHETVTIHTPLYHPGLPCHESECLDLCTRTDCEHQCMSAQWCTLYNTDSQHAFMHSDAPLRQRLHRAIHKTQPGTFTPRPISSSNLTTRISVYQTKSVMMRQKHKFETQIAFFGVENSGHDGTGWSSMFLSGLVMQCCPESTGIGYIACVGTLVNDNVSVL